MEYYIIKFTDCQQEDIHHKCKKYSSNSLVIKNLKSYLDIVKKTYSSKVSSESIIDKFSNQFRKQMSRLYMIDIAQSLKRVDHETVLTNMGRTIPNCSPLGANFGNTRCWGESTLKQENMAQYLHTDLMEVSFRPLKSAQSSKSTRSINTDLKSRRDDDTEGLNLFGKLAQLDKIQPKFISQSKSRSV